MMQPFSLFLSSGCASPQYLQEKMYDPLPGHLTIPWRCCCWYSSPWQCELPPFSLCLVATHLLVHHLGRRPGKPGETQIPVSLKIFFFHVPQTLLQKLQNHSTAADLSYRCVVLGLFRLLLYSTNTLTLSWLLKQNVLKKSLMRTES